MSNWKDIYKSRLTTADEAVRCIKSGDRVVLGHSNGEPLILSAAMARNSEHLKNVEVVHQIIQGPAEYAQPGMEEHFWHNSLFVSKSTRWNVNEGEGDFIPCHYHQTPYLFTSVLPVDVALVQVTPPDDEGFVSFGVSIDYTLPAAKAAKKVIAEVNDQYPYTMGDTRMHVSEIDYFVETSHDLSVTDAIEITEVESRIGQYCAELVEDESTLQFGIGGIPNAVLKFLTNKKDLGVHTEIITDNIMTLMESGALTNRKKGFHDGVSVGSGVMSSKEFHKYVDRNPNFAFYPVNYTNDPRNIAKCNKIVAINSCVQVDFMGQVCSEMIGSKQISGVGGQVDFIRGARWSPGGKAILACYSTAMNGTVSKIVPRLDAGACVTTARTDVEYIVTEYGTVCLRGVGVKARAKALIGIAHPKFRDQLWEEYEKIYGRKYVQGSKIDR